MGVIGKVVFTLQMPTLIMALLLSLCCSTEQQNVTILSPSPSLQPFNMSATINTSSALLTNETSPTVNLTVNMNVSVNPNQSSTAVVYTSASIISQITGGTKAENNTFFVEFQTGAIAWDPDLTKEDHNTYINTANKIVQIIDSIHSNMSIYKGSFVIGFREVGYVSVKLQFEGGDISNLDIFIGFLREGGGELRTDKVYLKLGKIADCIIAYVDTLLCDCSTMTYKRVITCRQPEIHGGQDCPEECSTGHTIAGSKDCSWDALDAFKCVAATVQPINITLMLIIVSTIYL